MNICILGAGAWGTAMSIHLERLGHTVTLVPRRDDQALQLATSRENTDYLPGHKLNSSIQIAKEIGPAVMEAEVVFFACPVKGLRELCSQLKPVLSEAWQLRLFVTLCKGLEQETLHRPSKIVEEELPGYNYGVLSGPTYADEVAQGKPTAIVFAAEGNEGVVEVQEAISSESLRVYQSADLTGVELGGCLKNIYAIGAGIADGLKLGDNARAAYLTRALNEMLSVGQCLGGEPATFFGLSGFGDMVATCSGAWSRNRCFGEALASGIDVEQFIAESKTVVEGYWATASIRALCQEHKLEAPILEEVYSVLYAGKAPKQAIHALMMRKLKSEF